MTCAERRFSTGKHGRRAPVHYPKPPLPISPKNNKNNLMGSYYVSFRDISNFNSKVETSCEMLSGVPASDVGGKKQKMALGRIILKWHTNIQRREIVNKHTKNGSCNYYNYNLSQKMVDVYILSETHYGKLKPSPSMFDFIDFSKEIQMKEF